MAISATHYALLKELRERDLLPQGGRILEIGQANWYGDAPPSIVCKELPDDADSFAIVRRLYEVLFDAKAVVSIDLDQAASGALRLDLTEPITLVGDTRWITQQFDVVMNHGTMEHPSQDLETQETIHRHCKPGGLIIHEAPYNQPEHGQRSYNFNFFTGMAAANKYEILLAAMEHLESRTYFHVESPEQIQEMHRRRQLPHDLMLFVAMRKTTDEPYVSKWIQDVYAGTSGTGRMLLAR